MSAEFDPYMENTADNRSAQVIQVTTVNVPLLVVMCVLTGMSLVGVAWSIREAQQARMEARVLQVKVEGFENALWSQKIDPSPHLRGQPE